jgi:hypothetical protein
MRPDLCNEPVNSRRKRITVSLPGRETLQVLSYGVRPVGKALGELLSVGGQVQGYDAPVIGPLLPLEESFGLQRRDGVADRGLGEVELPGEMAHSPELYGVVEQVDQELRLYGAEVALARLLPEPHAEDLRESL